MPERGDWKLKVGAALEGAHANTVPLTTKARLQPVWPQVLRLVEEGYTYSQIVGCLHEGGIEITDTYFRKLVARFRAKYPSAASLPKEVKPPARAAPEPKARAKWEPQKKFVWDSKSTDDVFRTVDE